MNTLSIVASFGALVWIFQDGNLSSILGFQPLGFVETTQPVILFCVLFGLSMDYEVFLLSRMKEVWDRTGDNVEAVAERDGAQRPDRDVGGAHRRPRGGDRSRSPTSSSSRPSASAWRSPWRSTRLSSGRSSSRPRCGCSGGGTGGCRRRSSGSSPGGCRRPRPRWRRRSDERSRPHPMTPPKFGPPHACAVDRLAHALPWRCSHRSSSSPAAAQASPILANADRSPARRSSRGRRRRSPSADPAPRGVATGRRAARPAHRVVVLHRPPASRRTAPVSASSSSSSGPSAAPSRRRGSPISR